MTNKIVVDIREYIKNAILVTLKLYSIFYVLVNYIKKYNNNKCNE